MAAGLKGQLLDPAEVVTAGTRVPLSAVDGEFQSLLVQADPDNNGNVYLGDETVDSSNGIALVPGEKLAIDGLSRAHGTGADSNFFSDWYIDADNDGAKLRILNLVRR